ncbi:MAG: cystathionine gamma-synthase [Steroidobacteraceae bacterium]
MTDRPDFTTRAVRAGLDSDEVTGAVVPPIHLSSTFAFRGYGDKRPYDYSRSGNPTRDHLSRAIADLEDAVGGVVTGSGMGAITLCGYLIPQGSRIIAPHDCYGGTYRLFAAWTRRGDHRVDFVRFDDKAALDAALAQPFAMLWIETPSNPLLRITDIEALASRAKARGAITVVDNTFLSPGWQKPISLGADLVLHSTTKYINGHSDVVGGAVVAATKELADQLGWWANCLGLTGSAFDSFLTLRGLRTLQARLNVHGHNAGELANWLAKEKGISRVFYPGLPAHPGHDIAKRQQTGFGAIITIELAGGTRAVKAFVTGLEFFSLAESLGGVESLVAHPGTMTHAAMDEASRKAAGLTDGLLRLSIGIESLEDLRRDLAAGLARATRA